MYLWIEKSINNKKQKIMSKIYTDNVEKARMLVKGVTENFDSVSSSGITIGAAGLKM